jgi:hypothetical protein
VGAWYLLEEFKYFISFIFIISTRNSTCIDVVHDARQVLKQTPLSFLKDKGV